jgi:diaminopimelate decarboxylase
MKKLKEFGVEGIDCVSIQECILAQLSGFEKDLIEYTANFISDDEIDYALKEQILLNVGELDTIERIGKKYKGARIIIRINPDIGSGECDHVITAGRHTKFGIPV